MKRAYCFRIRLCVHDSDKQMELFEEVRNILQEQNQKLDSVLQENQYLREKVSSLTEVRRFCAPAVHKTLNEPYFSLHSSYHDEEFLRNQISIFFFCSCLLTFF